MRRRLGRMIPIFAVALLVQLLAPIGAFRFVAAAIADPHSSVHLCAAMASADRDEAPASLPHDGGCCAICAVGLGGGPAPAASPGDFATIARVHQRLTWSLTEQAPPAARAGVNAQARAPPSRFAV